MIVLMIVCATSAFVAGAGFGLSFGVLLKQQTSTLDYLSDHTERMREKVR
jgi:hypothetical protein